MTEIGVISATGSAKFFLLSEVGFRWAQFSILINLLTNLFSSRNSLYVPLAKITPISAKSVEESLDTDDKRKQKKRTKYMFTVKY